MYLENKKRCPDGCNDYVTSDFVVFSGSPDECSNVNTKSRLTDVINNLVNFIKTKITRIRSTSLTITNDSSDCEKGFKIELVPSTQHGNQLTIGADGKPFVGTSGLTLEQIENAELEFKKPIKFDDSIQAETIVSSAEIVAQSFMIDQNGVQTIIPAFKLHYSNSDVYYFNDMVSYEGQLWYHHSSDSTSGIVPVEGNTWTLVVEKGDDGVIPSYMEMRFGKSVSATNPPSLNNTNPEPVGWSKTVPSTSTSEFVWFITGTKKGSDNSLIGTWSIPIRLTGRDGAPGQNGENGQDGEDGTGTPGQNGSDTEMRFAKNGSLTVPPAIVTTDVTPVGWSLNPPSLGDLEYLWMTKATKKNGALVGTWSTPIRMTTSTPGSVGNEPFKSMVFIRSATQPATPTGGTWASPIPAGWSDGIPSGTGIIWATTRWFTKDGQPPQTATWTTPYALSSSSELEIWYSNIPTNPGNPSTVPSYWHQTAETGDIWMAQRIVNNGIPGSWSVMRFRGEDGTSGGGGGLTPQNAYKSFVFRRASAQPTTPTGGSYSNPVPSNWFDGVPAGDTILWVSTRIFTSDGLSPQQPAWTTPQQMTNTASFRVKYSTIKVAPGTPTTQPANWNDNSSPDDWWMAWLFIENGVAGQWQVFKIRGEDGADGTGGGGASGPAGPFVSFRGVYDPFKQYYGGCGDQADSPARIDIVQYPDSNGAYYIARADAGCSIPVGTNPTNTTYWNTFEQQFESVATGLLFAKTAYVKNLCTSFFRTGTGTAQCNGDLPGTPTSQSAEHIEIYPSYSELNDMRGRNEPGFVGLTDVDLRNLSNTIIFYGSNDCGRRTKAHVDNVQLLKIQAVDARAIAPTTVLNPDGTSTTIPGYTVPASSIMYQRVTDGSIVRESTISPAFIEMKLNGTSKIFLDPNGASKFTESLVVSGTFNATYAVIDSLRVKGGVYMAGNPSSYTGSGGGIYASNNRGMVPVAKYTITGTTAIIIGGGIFTVPDGIQFVQLQYNTTAEIPVLEPPGGFEIVIINQTTSQVTVTTNGDTNHNIYNNGTFNATMPLGGRRVLRFGVMRHGTGPGLGSVDYYYTDNT